MLRAAVGWIERFHDRNRDELHRVTRQYTIACAALGLEIVLGTVNLSGRLGLLMASEKTPEVAPPEPKPNALSPRFPNEPPTGFGIPEKIGSIPGDCDPRPRSWWRRPFG